MGRSYASTGCIWSFPTSSSIISSAIRDQSSALLKSTIFLISEKNRIAVDFFLKKYFYIVLLCSFGGETFLEEIGVKVTCTVTSASRLEALNIGRALNYNKGLEGGRAVDLKILIAIEF